MRLITTFTWTMLTLSMATTIEAQTLSAVDSGWYAGDIHDPSNTNFFVGNCTSGTCGTESEYRNFFVFDPSGIDETITAATLCIQLQDGGLFTSDPSETYSVFDYIGDIDTLVDGDAGTDGFDDLGSGNSYGSVEVDFDDQGTLVTIPLNAQAVADLNAASDLFVVGGAITSLRNEFMDEWVFGFSTGADVVKLVVETEPSECFIVFGNGFDDNLFGPGLHEWITQVGVIRDLDLVTLTDLAEVEIPQRVVRRRAVSGPRQKAGSNCPSCEGSSLPWTYDLEFSAQIVMWNPQAFPEEPEQYSHGLHVVISPDGSVQSTPYGEGTGITLWTELDVNERGRPIIRFPFHIPGM